MLRLRIVLVLLLAPSLSAAEPLTLPLEKRPAWLDDTGIIMAGSWEPLPFRVRRDGAQGFTPTEAQRKDYQREHSPEMLEELKALGVNFVMMHAYKGAGRKFEEASMADAVRFAALCRGAGLRVGVYNFSGALLWEPFFKERPEAEQWVVRGDRGPITYGSAGYRYYWNRNHPQAQQFYRELVAFAVNEIKTDLVHLDNYHVGPGRDAVSVGRFREYLKKTFSPAELRQAGVEESLDSIQPPTKDSPLLLRCAWADFSCQSLADSYAEMARYARSLRANVLMECNPLGVPPTIIPPIDHGRLLQGGEAYWDESGEPGLRDGALHCRIRTYKVGRAMQNMAFSYITSPLEAAESMAFNLDCLGAICWFEYGKIVKRPGSKEPMSTELGPYVDFYRYRRDLFQKARVVADVAVLRSFPSQVFAEPSNALLTSRVEDLMIYFRMPFQILHDHQLRDASRYPALVLAGCVAMDDAQVEQVRKYVEAGGTICAIGPLATHDQWFRPRSKPALAELPSAHVVRVEQNGDWLRAIRQACGGETSLVVEPRVNIKKGKPVDAKENPEKLAGLCAELTEQPRRRLVHLVNYRTDGPVKDFSVRVALPEGKKAVKVRLASPERAEDLTVQFEQDRSWVIFNLPEVKVYEVATIEW